MSTGRTRDHAPAPRSPPGVHPEVQRCCKTGPSPGTARPHRGQPNGMSARPSFIRSADSAKARPFARCDRRRMSRRGPELRAAGRDDHAQAANERRAKTGIRRRCRKGVSLGVHGARERRVRGSHAFGDSRAVARGSSTSFEKPRVARRRKLRERAVVTIIARHAAYYFRSSPSWDVDLRARRKPFPVGGGELERLDVPMQKLERARAE